MWLNALGRFVGRRASSLGSNVGSRSFVMGQCIPISLVVSLVIGFIRAVQEASLEAPGFRLALFTLCLDVDFHRTPQDVVDAAVDKDTQYYGTHGTVNPSLQA
jgi:hypothetical protein